MQPHDWHDMVVEALQLIATNKLEKVVLARRVTIDADAPFDISSALRLLCASQPGCIVYADEGFLGATPELLVRRRGGAITSRPLAGTATSVEHLRASRKDAYEHDLVVRDVVDTLARSCRGVRVDGPAAVQFTDIAHLATTVTGDLDDEHSSALDLALALHPTPAVAGTPTDAALATIRRLESTPRGNYAGPCGWVDAKGDGEFVVALRCAELDGAHAHLYAGAGIVAGSDPGAEWAETQSKLEPMLRALVRP
jgi:menaquinone-specific isochorismate synthase